VIFSAGIIISSMVSYFIAKIPKKLNIYFAYFFLIITLLLCILLFFFTYFSTLCFILGFLLHQIIRVIIPAIASASEQAAIPMSYPYRTTVVSIGLFIKALFASVTITVSGFVVDGFNDFLIVLMALHALAIFSAFCVYLFMREEFREEKLI